MESLNLTVVLGAIVAVLGATSTFFAVRHQKVIMEIKELAEVVEESLRDGKITKDEQKEIMEEVVDVAHAIAESWSLKKS
tara:strand:- start:70 stop:309 length:240 start_codon:yes stop_codon:yes gene_type:complete